MERTGATQLPASHGRQRAEFAMRGGRTAQRARLAALLLLVAMLMGGCGLFETRDPETPTGSQASDNLALSPTEALIQLETAITLHDPNLYLTAISEEFEFAATPSAFSEDPAYFDDWSYTREDVFIRSLLSSTLLPPDSVATLTFTPIEEVSFADSAVFRESYTLEIALANETLPRVYAGLADLTLKREQDGGWRVVRWVDDAGGDEPSMSHLRAAL
ncbi:hypothetical protein KQI52_14280 [bacterium]|nr:hypothetical protein [bacterium]